MSTLRKRTCGGRLVTTGLVVAGLAFSGCAGVAGGRGEPAANRSSGSLIPDAAPPVELRKGMTPDEVRALLGEPRYVKPVRFSDGEAETWIYERGSREEVRQVPSGTQDVPYFDPFLNQIRMIPEPVYSQETITVTEELHLVWHHGELVEARTEYSSKRKYMN